MTRRQPIRALQVRFPDRGAAWVLAALVCAAVPATGAQPALAQEAAGRQPGYTGDRTVPVPIPRVRGEVILDGRVDEPFWDEIDPLPMTMHTPVFGGPLTERTEVRLAHDDRYLYLSGRLYDTEPDRIRTNTFYRDQYSGDDLLALIVDSYNDFETAVWFVTNPAGVRNDRTISNDAEFSQGMPMNSDWNAHWEVATTQTDEGWFAEFRIPFSTLGFQDVDGDVTMGVIIYRFIPRKNERQTYPPIEPNWGGLSFAKPSQAQRVVLRGVHADKPVYVTPFWLGGLTQTPVLADPPTVPSRRWITEDEPTREFGGDVRFSPTSNLTVDVTVNTDFAQVEADDQQINLTRFPLFFPEKRQFFQERASTFSFSTGGFTDRLFHSRRIGLQDGRIVRIYGGARAVGRIGGLDFGLLDMQTGSVDGRPGENMGVLRLNQQVLNPYSSVGGMLTSRLGDTGENNVAYGLDASLRLVGDEYLILKWAQSFDEAVEEADALSAGLIQARWERRRDEGLGYAAEFRRVGPDYLPRLGFQLRKDFLFYGGSLQYRHFLDDASTLRSAAVRMRTQNFLRLADRTPESRTIEPELHVEFRSGKQITVGTTSSFEDLDRPFSVAGVTIPEGRYWFHEARARVEFPRSSRFRGDFNASVGSFYDGRRVGLALNPTVTPSKYLEVTAGYEVNRLRFDARDAGTTTHLVRLKLATALDAHVSFSAFAQYSNLADLTSLNLRFRYHFREGTDLWIVWNEGLNMERANGLDPRLPLSAGRSIMVKYTHALIW